MEETVLLPRLRGLRLVNALSQRALGERAGVNPRTIMSVEGGRQARIFTARKLADALGLEPKDLMEKQS